MMKLLKTGVVLFAVLSGMAQAANISIRVNYEEGRSGLTFSPVQAQVGEFGLTPNLPDRGGSHWRVVVKDAKGGVLHDVAIRNASQRQVEVFDPKSGAIEQAQSVHQPRGAFEVSLPFGKEVASVEVLPGTVGKARTLSADAPLARFDRSALESVVNGTAASAKRFAVAIPHATATTIINNGPSNARMDYVFVGDGYTAAEMDKWHADAQQIIDGFMADPLFAANRTNMNVRRVDVASNQSGVDEPDLGIYRDTAMDGEFYCYQIARLLCVSEPKVLDIVGSVLAPDARDVIVVVSNSTRYGGSGGQVATLSMNAQSTEVALHEIGHTAFALADEYEYGTCDLSSEPAEGDVSLNGTRSVKWGSLIAPTTPVPTSLGSFANGTVGVFQGGQYCGSGKYRPTENSRMRTLGYPWHAVNERLAQAVFAKYVPAAPGAVTQTGSLAYGAVAYAPSAAPGYVQAGAGTITAQLTGAAGTDFDLYLYKYIGSAWTRVAASESSSSNESISYAGTAGYYYLQVKSYAGSGNYSLTYRFPPK